MKQSLRTLRDKRIKLAMYTSVASKAASFILQVLAIPVALTALGAERFGLYTILVSLLVWIDLGTAGIGPGLTRGISIAFANGDREVERQYFSSAAFLLVCIGTILILLLTILYYFKIFETPETAIENFIGKDAIKYQSEIIESIFIIGLFFILQLFFSLGERARSAYQEDYITNTLSFSSNILSLITMILISKFWPTITGFAIAIFGSLAISKLANSIWLLSTRIYLIPSFKSVRKSTLKDLLEDGLPFWIVQVASLLLHNLSLVLVGTITGATKLAEFAVIFRFTQLAATGVMMYTQPLWPAITHAAVSNDQAWINTAYLKYLKITLVYSSCVAIGLFILGTYILTIWTNSSLIFSQSLVSVLGIYFIIWMFNHFNTVVFFGFGWLKEIAFFLSLEAILAISLGMILTNLFGPIGMALALCLAGLVINSWALPLLIWNRKIKPFRENSKS